MKSRVELLLLLSAALACGAPVETANSSAPPKKIKHVAPVYPAESLDIGDEGTVALEVNVGRDGMMEMGRVVWSGCARLNDAALATVRQWRWDKFIVGGEARPWIMTVVVSFRLPEDRARLTRNKGACRWKQLPKGALPKREKDPPGKVIPTGAARRTQTGLRDSLYP